MTNLGTLAGALCVVCLSGGVMVTAFTPSAPKSMKSDFADFVVKPGYGPQFTSSPATEKTSVLLPNMNETEYRNFYAILGVSHHDDEKTIKQEYRKRAKQYHPDINPDVDAEDIFQEINRAYEVLSDPEMRRLYDYFGQNGIGTSAYSDDITAQEAEEFLEPLVYGEISASFGDCLDPKGFAMKKEQKKFHEKRRYVMYRNKNFSSIQTKLKKEKQREEASKRKGKHAFGQFYDARARVGFTP